MKLTPCQSSNVSAYGYDPNTSTLVVRFKGGSVYSYSGVPEVVFRGLHGAESKGAFLARHVTRNAAYAFAKMPPERAAEFTEEQE